MLQRGLDGKVTAQILIEQLCRHLFGRRSRSRRWGHEGCASATCDRTREALMIAVCREST